MYQVIVGNIGTVYSGKSKSEAMAVYDIYVGQSMDNYGRAAGEDVTLFEGGEPVKEYFGSLNYAE